MSKQQVKCKYCGDKFTRHGVNNHISAMHPNKPKMELPPKKTGEKQGKRNENGQFVKGETGNPDGRPSGKRNFHTEFEEAVEKIAEIRDGMNAEEIPTKIVMRGIQQALGGNYKFYKDILDRRYGKAKKRTDITTDGESLNKGSEELAEATQEIKGWLQQWQGDNDE